MAFESPEIERGAVSRVEMMAAPVGSSEGLDLGLERSPRILSADTTIRARDEISPYEELVPQREPRYFVEITRAAATRAFTSNEARQMASSIIEDGSVGVYYRPSSSLALGIEGGSGRYNQSLYMQVGTEAETSGHAIYRIDQRPEVIWLGLGARYSFELPVEQLQPFVQGTVGYGLDNGPIARGRAGVRFELSDHLSMSLAGEASSLIYMWNRQSYLTGKYGLTVGMQVGW